MLYTAYYNSPLGRFFLSADDIGLAELLFDGQKGFSLHKDKNYKEKENFVLKSAKSWLDIYFQGKEPDFTPPLHLTGSNFQKEVWEILYKISYGTTTTYGRIAEQIAQKRGIKRMSAQAVGGAVGHNKIAIIIPCHRVVGSNNSLTGYAAGIDKKIKLLELESVNTEQFFSPKD